jgi:hypothetical protein
MATPQSSVLSLLELDTVHRTHDMVFQPCLFLECKNCMTTAKVGAHELMKPCLGKDYNVTT